jgi:hypothetical protein
MTSRELFNRLDRRGQGRLTASDLLSVIANLSQCHELINSLNTGTENATGLSYEDIQRGFQLETTAVSVESSDSETNSLDDQVQSEIPENTLASNYGTEKKMISFSYSSSISEPGPGSGPVRVFMFHILEYEICNNFLIFTFALMQVALRIKLPALYFKKQAKFCNLCCP